MSIYRSFTGPFSGHNSNYMIDGHGDDAWQYKEQIRVNFSSNVLYGELDKGLLTHLQDKVADVTRYPEAAAQSLQAVAAAEYAVAFDQVLVTNGVTEAIYLAAQVFGQQAKSARVLIPSFAEYEDACRLHGLDVHLLPWNTLTPVYRFPAGLVFLCNPNNPTGAAVPVDQLRQLLRDNPHAVFVIDESYIEFTRATSSLLPELGQYPNVLLLRSLTKSCRIPGLRIGFAIGHQPLIRRLRAGKMPWSVNRLAIEAGLYIFSRQRFPFPLGQLLADTVAWRDQLQVATGWPVEKTDTHYFLVKTPLEFTAAALKQYLVSRHGLLIRDAANFKGLTPSHFRVACQSPEHNQLLTEALSECARTGL
jgi:threonine-phosphate decarboxylase